MAIHSGLLEMELNALSDVDLTEDQINAAIAEADAALSNWASIPQFVQHVIAIVAHFGTISAEMVTAAVAENWTALRAACNNNESVTAEVQQYCWTRLGTVVGSDGNFDLNATHP